MPRSYTKRIVVDASVARAAGRADEPLSSSRMCREVLSIMLAVCHRVVLSNEGAAEVLNHQSSWTQDWLTVMAQRGKVITLDAQLHKVGLHAAIPENLPQHQRIEIEKDLHLLDSALQTDRIVLSLDDRARANLGEIPGIRRLAGAVIWVNPTAPGESAAAWLRGGARAEEDRRLRA